MPEPTGRADAPAAAPHRRRGRARGGEPLGSAEQQLQLAVGEVKHGRSLSFIPILGDRGPHVPETLIIGCWTVAQADLGNR